ncbi:MAG: polyphosphate polymerase domain-containing protein, partial [Treponema sp.]|nr:polyphosphate polymerase domain-containing protein [Treponema sp.]
LIAQNMFIDLFGDYIVQNLYYDTNNWDIIRESVEKPLYKEKLRLRLYGQYNSESRGFLELKKKYNGIVYKRRFAFPLSELKKRNVQEIVSADNSQISREIDFYLKRKQVSEKIYIAYKRIAYTGGKLHQHAAAAARSLSGSNTENNELRITFDKDIVFRLNSLDSFKGIFNPNNGRQILRQNQMLMEIKTTGVMPLWLARTLSENNIFSIPFSKVGICFTEHILKRQGFKDFIEVKNAA